MALDNQVAQLKIKQGCGTHLGALILPGELLNPTLSLPNAVAPHLLELCSNVDDFDKVGFFLIQSLLIGSEGSPWKAKLGRNV